MRSLLLFAVFCLFLSVIGCGTGAVQQQAANRLAADDTLWLITDLQDHRATDSLVALHQHPSATYREAVALALASVQDTAALSALYRLLNDTEPRVRKMAAYAIGQTGSTQSAAHLIFAIQKDKAAEVTAAAAEALGKCADSAALQVLAALRYDAPEQAPQRYGQMTGLYRALTWKRLRLPAGDSKALSFLAANYPDSLRVMAANYFARNPDKAYDPITRELLSALSDNHPHVRLNIALALGNSALAEVQQKLLEIIQKDAAYEVRVAALRAIGSQKNPASLEPIQEIIGRSLCSTQPNIAVTAAEAVRNKADKVNIKYFYSIIDSVRNPRARALVMGTVMKFHPSGGQSFVEDLLKKSTDPYEQGFLLKALAEDTKNNQLLAKYLSADSNHPFVRTSALEGLLQIQSRADFATLPDKDFVRQQITAALGSKDAALIALAAGAIANPANGYAQYLKGDTTLLYQAKQGLPLPRDIETLIEIEKAIAHITGRPAPKAPQLGWNHPIDRKTLASIKQGQEVLIKTTQGDIVFRLLPEQAPGSVVSFIKLVQQGYYNGKTFHRVVPDFVVQGGCPRGDGYGGMDYTLRSEFAPLHYHAGAVGLASAGKDTESCQWFISHIPTPHLDGRYTIFAEVKSGMETVHKLGVGDKMLEVVLQ
ncbi:peptidylprolyl isomerase [Rhodoflexus caldus]|uniref:peptidylprolyl isomerase n=1 Tax=Rhodoflexus caldus TaxID=2891236 RepID=UPI00202A12FF|nr:peptidylprolyl isomerase [Rhodoflexus caldus]